MAGTTPSTQWPDATRTRPTASLPMTVGSAGLPAPRSRTLRSRCVVDAERLDLDDHVAGLGFRVRNFFVPEAVEPVELLQDDCPQSGPPGDGYRLRWEKGVDRGRDLRAIRFQCEVTGVEEQDERTRDIPLERLGARRSTWERSTLILPAICVRVPTHTRL